MINLVNTKSAENIYNANMPVSASTIKVDSQISDREGQVTLDISRRTSFKYAIAFLNMYPIFSNLTNLAGLEGLEPPTTGFGDRSSAKLSYRPVLRS